jgi:transcriptional regulator with XRE-family HTH domain
MRTPLKKHLYAKEIEQKELCKVLKRSQTYITQRMTGKKPFDMDEVYTICSLANIPHDEIADYFLPTKVEIQTK